VSTFAAEPGGGGVEGLLLAGRQHHPRPRGGKGGGNGETDASRRAGHEGDPTPEIDGRRDGFAHEEPP
jgi:hypothetical protein